MNHLCQCESAGFCTLFGRVMDEREHHICQTASQTPLRAQFIAEMYARTGAGQCVYKGDPLLDQYGHHRTRAGCGCAGALSRLRTHLYQCSAPGAPREAEDHCEDRCGAYRPTPAQPVE